MARRRRSDPQADPKAPGKGASSTRRPPSDRGRRLLTLAILAVLLAVILAVVLTSPLLRPASRTEPVVIGFTDLDGQQRTTAEPGFRGQVVIVDLMAATCPPCNAEMPELLAFWSSTGGQGVVLLSLSIWVDRPGFGETVEDLVRFKERWGAGWPFGVPENAVDLVIEYSVSSPPFKLVLDRDGRLVTTLPGTTTAAQLEAAVEMAS